jgi:nucleoid-associated protein YgaU
VIAAGAVAVVAAALIAYYLIGSGGQEAPRAAGDPASAEQTQTAASTSEAPPPAPTPAAESVAAVDNGSAAAPQAEAEASGAPVVQVKPRPPASSASGTSASSAAPAKVMPAEAAATMPAMEAPSFDVVRVEKTGETVIAGRAAPDSEVNVTAQDGSSLGRTKADASGAWAIVPEQPLTPGSHEIGVEAQNAEGAAALSEEVVVVVVPEPKAPAAAAPKSTAGSADTTTPAAGGAQVLAVLTPRQGGGSKVLPQDPEDGIVHGDLVLDSVDYNEDGMAVVGGRAAPGSRVVIYLDNRLLGDSVAGVDGRWSHAPENPVAEGLHQLRVDQVDGSGKVIARVETPFSRQAVRVATADEAFVIVQPGNSLWRIARRTYGQGLQYSVIYQANKDQIRDPDLIYPGQVFELPTTNSLCVT